MKLPIVCRLCGGDYECVWVKEWNDGENLAKIGGNNLNNFILVNFGYFYVIFKEFW